MSYAHPKFVYIFFCGHYIFIQMDTFWITHLLASLSGERLRQRTKLNSFSYITVSSTSGIIISIEELSVANVYKTIQENLQLVHFKLLCSRNEYITK